VFIVTIVGLVIEYRQVNSGYDKQTFIRAVSNTYNSKKGYKRLNAENCAKDSYIKL